MEQCKGLLTNAGDEDIVESAWLRVNSDGSQIERYLWVRKREGSGRVSTEGR